MNRCDHIGKDDDLLVSKSADSDLKNGKTSVNEEGQAYDQISQRKLKIHKVECDKETECS